MKPTEKEEKALSKELKGVNFQTASAELHRLLFGTLPLSRISLRIPLICAMKSRAIRQQGRCEL